MENKTLNKDYVNNDSGGKAVARLSIIIASVILFVYFLGLFAMPVYAR